MDDRLQGRSWYQMFKLISSEDIEYVRNVEGEIEKKYQKCCLLET